MKSEIVPATAADKDKILALYNSLKGDEMCNWDESYPDAATIDFDLERDALFVLKDEKNEVLAAISLDLDPEVEGLLCWDKSLAPGGELSRLAIRKDLHNMGLAKKMMAHALAVLKERGYKSAHILVYAHNQKALRSYAFFGYRQVGECNLHGWQYFCFEKKL